MTPLLLVETDAARYLGISRKHMAKLRKAGRIRPVRLDDRRFIWYRVEDLDRFVTWLPVAP